MTALAQIEESLSRLTAGELAEVQTMLDRLQRSETPDLHAAPGPAKARRPDRPTFEEIEPLLEKAELTEAELEKIVRYNGFPFLPRRPGPPVTNEMVQQLIEEEGI